MTEQAFLSPIVCTKCNFPVARGLLVTFDNIICLNCRSELNVYLFPSFFRHQETGADGELLTTETEASCFYHPDKRASTICNNCGRFVCSLCDLEFKEKHICPQCLDHGRSKSKIQDLQFQRTNYDHLALLLALAPLLIFYFTIITAPIALYIAIRYWNAPLGITRKSKIRFILAIFIASLEIIGWVIAIIAIYYIYYFFRK